MKILSLRFRNLNSLVGEWGVDFRDSAYVAEGIFAIVGATGAGKTTILDAICLGLYGETPRLGRITGSGNEIMSRHTGECEAEVVFGTVSGEYRVHWSQRRSRGKVDGKLQAPKHEISRVDTGEVLESMLSRVGGVVEGVCGMDFERFTRSVMLAQGSFAKFLKSSADERSPILEQITGTGIYSEISKLVHERYAGEKASLKELEAGVKGITLMEDDEEVEVRKLLDEVEPEYLKASGEHGGLLKAIAWVDGLAKERGGVELLEGEVKVHGEVVKGMAEKRARYERAMVAHEVEGAWVGLCGAEERLKKLRTELGEVKEVLPGRAKAFEDGVECVEVAKKILLEAKGEVEKWGPILKKAAGMEVRVGELVKGREKVEEELLEVRKVLKGKVDGVDGVGSSILDLEKGLVESAAYVERFSGDAGLGEAIGGIREMVKAVAGREVDLATILKRVSEGERVVKEAEVKVEECLGEVVSGEKKLGMVKGKLGDAEGERSKLLGEHTKVSLEEKLEELRRRYALEQRVVNLERYRAELVDGEACPLCGALEHPACGGDLPELDVTKAEGERLGRRVKELGILDEGIGQLKVMLAGAEGEVKAAGERRLAGEKRLGELREGLGKVRGEAGVVEEDFAKRKLELGELLEKFGVSGEGALGELEERVVLWKKHGEVLAVGKERRAGLEGDLKAGEVAVKEFSAREGALVKELDGVVRELVELRGEIGELLGGRKLEEVSAGLEKGVGEGEARLEAAVGKRDVLGKALDELRVREGELVKRVVEAEGEREVAVESFRKGLEERGFAGRDGFLVARMGDEERGVLGEELKAVERRGEELAVRLAEGRKRVSVLEAEAVTDLGRDVLLEREVAAKKVLEALAERRGKLKERLDGQMKAREALAERVDLISKQKVEYERWGRLHGLIGSADGKRFRNFAQGLTFEVMVRHANVQLAKMSDRYLLERDLGQPLDLNVVDLYQAGEVRSTKNLSGGESFIVSLALALGLSQMASSRVRVDSLFLDEGFGTLDDEALEVALDTLGSLQQEGKLIGVISHVEALKERIGTQLRVERGGGGNSRLVGPGVFGG